MPSQSIPIGTWVSKLSARPIPTSAAALSRYRRNIPYIFQEANDFGQQIAIGRIFNCQSESVACAWNDDQAMRNAHHCQRGCHPDRLIHWHPAVVRPMKQEEWWIVVRDVADW